MRNFRNWGVPAFVLALFFFQAVATFVSARHASQVAETVVEQLRTAADTSLSSEKAREEAIKLRVENATKGFVWTSVLAGLAPMITTTVALVAMWLGLFNYLDARDKERLDRAAVDLKEVLERLVSKEARERAVGVVGLQHFMTPDKKTYHVRVLSALVAAARLEDDPEVLRGIRLAVQEAVTYIDAGILGQVSWQGVTLRGINLKGQHLDGIDFRDAELEDSDLSKAHLTSALLTNARLNGSKLNESNLAGANLTYADVAGASLVKADLRGAELFHAKVMDMDLDGADLRGAHFDWEKIPWELVRNWRTAKLDQGVIKALLERYGAGREGRRVLMLMWETAPLVAGGTWTACYHLVRSLRRLGADVTVAVPWDEASLDSNPFGAEAEVIPLGIKPPESGSSPYSASGFRNAPWSPYAPASAATPYYSSTYPAWSPYSPSFSPYFGVFSGYSVVTDKETAQAPGSGVLRLSEEFKSRLLGLLQRRKFDVIHAHDWVTFEAARAAAAATGKPWVAHFHSTESERRPQERRDAIIANLEEEGARDANHVVAPSSVTAAHLRKNYEISEDRITVVPNTLSRGDAVSMADTGRFETRRVVFLGRVTWQKGPDFFAGLQGAVHRRRADITFLMYGAGEEVAETIRNSNVQYRGPLKWNARDEAFRGASAIVVPSREEPFGMVILEAMQHRVPVLYPEYAGAAEVIKSGIRIRPDDSEATAGQLIELLADLQRWEKVVREQTAELAEYVDRDYPERILKVWDRVTAPDARPQDGSSSVVSRSARG